MVIAQIVLLAAAALPVEITVRIAAPNDPCELARRVPASLERVFPGLSVILEGQAPSAERSARVLLAISAAERGVHLELEDEDGKRALVRDLPSSPEACAATADGIALVVERYLRDLGYEPSALAPPELARTSTVPPAAPVRAVRTATAAREISPPAIEEPPVAISLAAGARALGGVGLSPGRGAIGGAGMLRLGIGSAPIAIELLGEVGAAVALGAQSVVKETTGVVVGSTKSWSIAALGGAGACTLSGPVRICANARAGFERVSANSEDTSGGLFNRPESQAATTPIFAGELRGDWFPTSRFGLTFGAGALVRTAAPRFEIGGARDDYLVPRWALTFGLGGWVTIF